MSQPDNTYPSFRPAFVYSIPPLIFYSLQKQGFPQPADPTDESPQDTAALFFSPDIRAGHAPYPDFQPVCSAPACPLVYDKPVNPCLHKELCPQLLYIPFYFSSSFRLLNVF